MIHFKYTTNITYWKSNKHTSGRRIYIVGGATGLRSSND